MDGGQHVDDQQDSYQQGRHSRHGDPQIAHGVSPKSPTQYGFIFRHLIVSPGKLYCSQEGPSLLLLQVIYFSQYSVCVKHKAQQNT
jgi:hypothetical protein